MFPWPFVFIPFQSSHLLPAASSWSAAAAVTTNNNNSHYITHPLDHPHFSPLSPVFCTKILPAQATTLKSSATKTRCAPRVQNIILK